MGHREKPRIYKKVIATLILLGLVSKMWGQEKVKDQANIYQQERMVFKQWDRNKFTPKWKWYDPGSYLNYSLTWLLHPDYPKKDIRPLSAKGQQTQRMALALAMQMSTESYKKQSDTLLQVAVDDYTRIMGTATFSDPMYNIYYRRELEPIETADDDAFKGVKPEAVSRLIKDGDYEEYKRRFEALAERYSSARTADMERGERLLMFHRILLDMRKVKIWWGAKAGLANAIAEQIQKPKTKGVVIPQGKSEEEILNGILTKMEVIK